LSDLKLAVSEKLTYCTVRIECILKDGSTSTGTGFFFNFLEGNNRYLPTIVTNKHVVKDAVIGRIPITIQDSNGNPQTGSYFNVEVPDFERKCIFHPEDDVDLCVLPITFILNTLESHGVKAYNLALTKAQIPTAEDLNDLTALEEVIMIGYPNGIWDHVNNLPIVRSGVTATHPNIDYQGRPEFMIDAACFPGSSGSPVLLYNQGSYVSKSKGVLIGGTRLMLLGVLYAGPQHTASGEIKIVNIPTRQEPVVISRVPNNLGLIIKSRKIIEFEEILRNLIAEKNK